MPFPPGAAASHEGSEAERASRRSASKQGLTIINPSLVLTCASKLLAGFPFLLSLTHTLSLYTLVLGFLLAFLFFFFSLSFCRSLTLPPEKAIMAALDYSDRASGKNEGVVAAPGRIGVHADLGSSEELREGVGALDFEQYTTGGMGRHLGVFSTTSLMYVCSLSLYIAISTLISVRIPIPPLVFFFFFQLFCVHRQT